METDKHRKTQISTLIFMDLETTGLPCDVGKKNVHITEMSLVAINRASFEDDINFRALNKLSLCIRPRSVVSPGAMCVTGLYNDILENQEEFDDSVPKLLEYFFRRLQPPICLLAHNGNKFDFPVLQAELKRINYSLASDILCADTLVAFRSICRSLQLDSQSKEETEKGEMHSSEKEKLHSKKIKSCEKGSITEDDIEVLLSQDLDMFIHMEETLIPDNENVLKTCTVNTSFTSNNPKFEFLDQAENEKTPKGCKIASNFNQNGNNAKKQKTPDSTFTPKKDYKVEVRPVKRSLFSAPDPVPRKITKFTLENLYCHFFNEKPPKSHYAEVDCVSLSKVCQKINEDFLPWIDENSMAFCDISALW